MADESVVVDDDESEIVTNFLLNTCRLGQPTDYHVWAAAMCGSMSSTVRNPPDDVTNWFERASTINLTIFR